MKTQSIPANACSGATSLFQCVILILVSCSIALCQPFSPYSDFQAMTPTQLQTLQVKLTYVGVQTRPIPSLAFTSPSHTLNLGAFVPFRRPGVFYGNDDISVRSFVAAVAELDAVIDNVAGLPNVTAGGVAADQYLSFSLLNTVGPKAFEAVIDKADTAGLFEKLRLALTTNRVGLQMLHDMACPLFVLDPARPSDVSSNVSVTISGVRLNRATGRYVATATAKNNSASSISGPISLVLEFKGNIRLVNGDGSTCGTSPVGRAFINLSLTGNSLPGGGVSSVTLDLENPDREPIQIVLTKVLAGPGAR